MALTTTSCSGDTIAFSGGALYPSWAVRRRWDRNWSLQAQAYIKYCYWPFHGLREGPELILGKNEAAEYSPHSTMGLVVIITAATMRNMMARRRADLAKDAIVRAMTRGWLSVRVDLCFFLIWLVWSVLSLQAVVFIVTPMYATGLEGMHAWLSLRARGVTFPCDMLIFN